MHLVFGLHADGPTFPAFPGSGNGCLDAMVVGPAGLLDALALQLGLTGPHVPTLLRIAAWQAKLEAASAEAARFYSASLASRPWATATVLLGWRDELVEGGWTGSVSPEAPRRIIDLAAAEQSGPVLPQGRADLLRAVTERLEEGAPLATNRIEVIGGIARLPPAWRRLIASMARNGSASCDCAEPAPSGSDSDLGRAQRFLLTGAIAPLRGDGSLTLLTSRTTLMAAEAVGEWLSTQSDGPDVLIAPDGDTSLLDQSLSRRGSPNLGLSSRSPHRGALQILSLSFAIAWRPFDPQALLDLLLMPHPPLRRWAARRLAGAIVREPGIGGPEWEAAWTWIEARIAEDPQAGCFEELSEWRAWTAVGRHDRSAGIPAADAADICLRVRRWALATDRGARSPLLLCVVGAADLLLRAFRALGHSPISPVQLEDMVDTVLAEGMTDPSRLAEAGRHRAVRNAGALWAPVQNVLWWRFAEGGDRVSHPWMRSEISWLANVGCSLDPAGSATDRTAADWRRVVLCARESLMLVAPARDGATEFASHPLLHRLSPLLAADGGRDAITVPAERLLGRGRTTLARQSIHRAPADRREIPTAKGTWALPAAISGAIAGRTESASSLEDLMACQMRWVLQHVTGVRRGGAGELPDANRLIGNLAHAIAQQVFVPGTVPEPIGVKAAAAAALDEWVDRIAAPLRLPGLSGDFAFARARIPDSLGALAALLKDRELTVVALEAERQAQVHDVPLRSRIDMVVSDPEHCEHVVDLKWTKRPNVRRKELVDGRAIQLAVYSRLIEPSGSAGAGYYLLKQRTLLVEQGPSLGTDPCQVTRSLRDTWDAVASDWSDLSAIAARGRGLSLGAPSFGADLPIDLQFPRDQAACINCAFATLCRITMETRR